MITQESKDKLNQYATLKQELKLLEEKCDALNPEVLAIMQEAEVEEIQISDIGKLSLSSRRIWKYSIDVDVDEDVETKK